jgi:glutamyl-Q tRNA(Asp) synthetase
MHFGSMVAALASWLEARTRGGAWLLRIEDVDQPRVMAGAAESILRTLEAAGMDWDGTVTYQSSRTERYSEALDQLRDAGLVFPCACSRREIADSLLEPGREPVYPGTCRNGLPAGKTARAWRARCGSAVIEFQDAVQGSIRQDLALEAGDFVVRRADSLFAYQLAVVVDDADQGITDVVRGADLLDSTPRQIHLQRALGLPTPNYAHVPVAVTPSGEKLSKQTLAPALTVDHCAAALASGLEFLGQAPPPWLSQETPRQILAWAQLNWQLSRVPRQRSRLPGGSGISGAIA